VRFGAQIEISNFVSRYNSNNAHRYPYAKETLMKYDRFEELPVWQLAARFAADLLVWSANPMFRGKGDLANQIQRATLSISNNIAEGFERGTTQELLTFLYYARGSAGEVRSMLSVAGMLEDFSTQKRQIEEFKSTAESISRQLRGWASSLQNSTIQGQRHLNEQTKQTYDRQQRVIAHEKHRTQWKKDFEERLRNRGAAKDESNSVQQDENTDSQS
jgi:four helix bundle protein